MTIETSSQRAGSNWAGNYRYVAPRLHEPATVEELQRLITDCRSVKALGSRHSFNDIADCAGDQVSLHRFDSMTLDAEGRSVTVGAGVTYGRLAPWLDSQGFALPNLASLPHITVVGACATGTHGSGMNLGNLATAVTAIEFVNGRGELVSWSRRDHAATFAGAMVGLGALGVVTRITLRVVPSYEIAQTVYENLSFDELEENCDAIFGSGYSVSLFTDWDRHRATQAWVKRNVSGTTETAELANFYGATRQRMKLRPLDGGPIDNCTGQEGIPGRWFDRLPHFRMDFVPSSGNELQSEYCVPRSRAAEAIRAVESLRESITPNLLISELRTIAADDLWMSMAYERDSLAIHFTWKPEWDKVRRVLPSLEEALAPLEARPHWGKLFTTAPAVLERLYPRLGDFLELAGRLDPEGKFRNPFLNKFLFRA